MINVILDHKVFEERFRLFPDKKLRFALSLAMNRILWNAQKYLKEKLPSIFDRPTPWTVNSTFVKPARKEDLTAYIEHKSFATKGVPTGKLLLHLAWGEDRRQKRSEKLLEAAGILKGKYIVPTRATPLDQYGNPKTSVILQMLSSLQATLDTSGYSKGKGRAKGTGKSLGFFVGTQTERTRQRIYQIVGRGKVIPFMVMKKDVHYKPTYHFDQLMTDRMQSQEKDIVEGAINQAIDTARL